MMEVSSVASQLHVVVVVAAGGHGWLWVDARTNQDSPPDLQCELEDSPPGRSDRACRR